MKKLFAILLALTLILTACGGESGKSGEKTAADITADNWTSIVAECFGLELSLPEGWSVKSARSPNGVTNVELIFTVGGDATYATFGESNGELTWHHGATHTNCRKYIIEVNGVESESGNSSYDYLAHGDVIRIKAIAHENSDIWLDSDWSEPYTFRWSKDYDFANLGLGGEAEARLMLVESKGAGTYKIGDSKYIVCKNGDFIIDGGGEDKIEVYTKSDYGYYSIGMDHYEHTVFGKNYKKEYYSGYMLNLGLISLMPIDSSAVVSDGLSYVSSRGRTLLEAGVPVDEKEKSGRCELWSYTEYTGKINTDYLFTTYMHPETRKFGWISPYSGKIKSWNVNYIEHIGLEDNVVITFTDDFTSSDCTEVKNILKGYGFSGGGLEDVGSALSQMTPDQLAGLDPEMLEKLLGILSGTDTSEEGKLMGNMNSFEGIISVYTMPFEHEGDDWEDKYYMLGMPGLSAAIGSFRLQVDYLYEFWYDGGSFATYTRTHDGLWRSTPDSGMYVIDKDGNRLA